MCRSEITRAAPSSHQVEQALSISRPSIEAFVLLWHSLGPQLSIKSSASQQLEQLVVDGVLVEDALALKAKVQQLQQTFTDRFKVKIMQVINSNPAILLHDVSVLKNLAIRLRYLLPGNDLTLLFTVMARVLHHPIEVLALVYFQCDGVYQEVMGVKVPAHVFEYMLDYHTDDVEGYLRLRLRSILEVLPMTVAHVALTNHPGLLPLSTQQLGARFRVLRQVLGLNKYDSYAVIEHHGVLLTLSSSQLRLHSQNLYGTLGWGPDQVTSLMRQHPDVLGVNVDQVQDRWRLALQVASSRRDWYRELVSMCPPDLAHDVLVGPRELLDRLVYLTSTRDQPPVRMSRAMSMSRAQFAIQFPGFYQDLRPQEAEGQHE